MRRRQPGSLSVPCGPELMELQSALEDGIGHREKQNKTTANYRKLLWGKRDVKKKGRWSSSAVVEGCNRIQGERDAFPKIHMPHPEGWGK